ncbi:MAG: triple tyrosine motif-containing protein, partial [Acidobacteriota bacterium]
MPRSIAILLLGAWLAVPALAQRPNLRHYSARDGLPQAQILSITQDVEGYLWMGSYAGVSRYDGQRFLSLSSEDGLPSNTVRQLLALRDGRVAARIGSRDFCLLRKDGGAGSLRQAFGYRPKCYTLGSENGRLLDMAALRSEDGRGAQIFLGGLEGVWSYAAEEVSRVRLGSAFESPQGSYEERAIGTSRLRIQALEATGRTLWVGTDRGLYQHDLTTGSTQLVAPFAGTEIHALLETAEKALVVATEGGLASWKEGRLEWARLAPGRKGEPLGLAQGQDGWIWMASSTGVFGWRDQEITVLDESRGLPGRLAHAVFADRENSLWIGTDFGVTKMVPGPFLTYGLVEGAPGSMVRAVGEDAAGRLWIGTRQGVARREGEVFSEIELPGLADRRIFSLAAEDPESGDGMWIGSSSGLLLWRSRVVRAIGEAEGLSADSTPMSLVREPDSGLWVGTDLGIFLVRGGRLKSLDPRLDELEVNSLLRPRPGELWVGLQQGGLKIVRFRVVEGKPVINEVETLGRSEGLTDFAIWDLDVDPRGNIWVGSNGDGVFRVAPDGELRQITKADGLVNDFVWQVLCDDVGDVWLFTSRGLNRWREGEVALFGFADGLPDLEGTATAALQDRAGKLWFGTGRGIVRFDRQQEVTNQVPPVVVIEGLRSQELGLVSPGAKIPHGSGVLEVSYSALSFREESAVRFRYRLEGDSATAEWSEPLASRSLSFASLGAGSYRLQIEAANEAGTWSVEPAEISFEVLSAWWQSPVFLGASFLAVMGLAAGGLRWRTWHLEAEKERLETLVSERAAELEKK